VFPLDAALLVELEVVFRLLLAVALGAVVGYERQRADKPANLRDYLLVSLGSATFTVVSIHGFPGGDAGRVAAQIVTGIGFLGAGVIIRQQGTIVGVTTAAGIWVCAGIGMACATGLYTIAVATTLVAFLALRLRHHEDL
jgi:putative Mg2+ transporter-C (MgtC) family protein